MIVIFKNLSLMYSNIPRLIVQKAFTRGCKWLSSGTLIMSLCKKDIDARHFRGGEGYDFRNDSILKTHGALQLGFNFTQTIALVCLAL